MHVIATIWDILTGRSRGLAMERTPEQVSRNLLASADIVNHVADGVYVVDMNRRIGLWNKAAERITGFTAKEVEGRGCADSVLTHTDCAGKSLCKGLCPVASTLADGKARQAVVNLHHKSGHRIPVHIDVSPVRNEQGQIIGAVETFRECSDVIAMRSAIEHLKHWGCIDVQSGLAARRIVEGRLAERQQEMQRYGWAFGILVIEIDMFKEVRARFGDDGLTAAIRMAGMCVSNSLRSLDTVGRWDDETFLAIVANTTATELAVIAERVRTMVDTAYKVSGDSEIHVTVSIGAAAADPRDNVASLLLKAQKCLYTSRTQGRNRVTIHGLQPEKADGI